MRFTRVQKVRIANFSGSAGTSYLSPVEEQLKKKGVIAVREGDFMMHLSWGEGWEEKAVEIRRELAEEIRPKLSDEAAEALVARKYHPEIRSHDLGYDRGKGKLMRERLGGAVAELIEAEG